MLFLIVFKSSVRTRRQIIKKNNISGNNSIVNEDNSSTTFFVNNNDSTFRLIGENSSSFGSFNNSSGSISPLSTSTYVENTVTYFKTPNDNLHVFGQRAIFDNPLTPTRYKFKTPPPSLNGSFRGSLFDEPSVICNNQRKPLIDRELRDKLEKLHLNSFDRGGDKSNIYRKPGVFEMTGVKQRPKPVLSPPKLSNVTQSSWVAGGYWKPSEYLEGFASPPLSRSSSQSSGFGSQSSSQNNLNGYDAFGSLPSSRNTSVCGEIDKFSVLSEPAYHTSRNSGSYNPVYPVLRNEVCIYPRKYQNVSNNKGLNVMFFNDICKGEGLNCRVGCGANGENGLSYRPSSRASLLSQTMGNGFGGNAALSGSSSSVMRGLWRDRSFEIN